MAAFDNNTATEEDKQILQGFRQTIADIAQKLPDDTTTIAFQYETKPNEYRVIAHSGKLKISSLQQSNKRLLLFAIH